MAERFRDEGRVLLFADNICNKPLTLAGTEVSALRPYAFCGRLPTYSCRRNGYRARSVSRQLSKAPITSVQAVCRTPGWLDWPVSKATTFAHLDATVVLNRNTQLWFIPSDRPARFYISPTDPLVVGQEHYDIARGVQSTLQRYKELKDIIAIPGMDELSEEDKQVVSRARKTGSFLPYLTTKWSTFTYGPR